MDTVHWPQEMAMEEMVTKNSCSKAISSNNSSSLERKARPQKESAVNCPRCNSTNTKFCYYNNYSLSQPRYFCKTCRRYWTEGGSLRNVPVGGGSRKNKRSSSSSFSSPSSFSSSMSKKLPDLVVPPAPPLSQNPRIMHHGQDLNLGFPSSHDFSTISELIQAPSSFDGTKNNNTTNSALQLLTGRGSMMMNSFIPMPVPDSNSVYSSSSGELMIPMTTEFKIPSLNFSLDGIGGSSNSSGRLLFPFEDLKTTSNDDDGHQNRDQLNGDTNGFWSGMLGGGSW